MKIQIYTTQWCPDCWRAKRFLKENEVAFDEIDIEQDEQAVQLVMEKNNGRRTVPTIEIDGAYFGNPSIPQLARIAGIPI